MRPDAEVDEMGRLFVVAALGGTAAFVVLNMPDIKRYFKIRSM